MIRRLHRKDREQARDYGESVAKLVVAHADFPHVWHQVFLSLSLSLSLSRLACMSMRVRLHL